MKLLYVVLILLFFTLSCSAQNIINKNHNGLFFSKVKSNLSLHDINNYGCNQIKLNDLSYLLENSTIVSKSTIHDHYSIVGCSVNGTVFKNKKKVEFTFDYGGIFYFSDGVIIACGELCCNESYEFCSWDTKVLTKKSK
jgi:hypothetical protein